MLVSADLPGPAPRSPEARYANIELNMRTLGITDLQSCCSGAGAEHKYLHLAPASVFIPAPDNRSMAGGTLAPGHRVNSLLLCSCWLGQIIDSEGSQNNILPIYIYTATVARLQDGSGEALTGSSDSVIPQDTSPLVNGGVTSAFKLSAFGNL